MTLEDLRRFNYWPTVSYRENALTTAGWKQKNWGQASYWIAPDGTPLNTTEAFIELIWPKLCLQQGYRTIHQMLSLCQVAHRNQKRTDGRPYFDHLFRVADMVYLLTEDSTCVKSALGHDLIEDQNYLSEALEIRFGYDVVRIIKDLTNDYSDHLPHEEKLVAVRKHTENHITDERTKLIKLVDRLDNIMDTSGWKPSRILRYCDNTEVLLDALHLEKSSVYHRYLADRIAERVTQLRSVNKIDNICDKQNPKCDQ